MDRCPIDWPPMIMAMQRVNDRATAITGSPDAMQHFDGEGDVLGAIRRVLSGTDVDPLAVSAMINHLSSVVPAGVDVALPAPFRHVVNGLLLDAFMVGYYTREAMAGGD